MPRTRRDAFACFACVVALSMAGPTGLTGPMSAESKAGAAPLLPPLPSPRSFAVLIGGSDGRRDICAVDVYCAEADRWTAPIADAPVNGVGSVVATESGLMVVIGLCNSCYAIDWKAALSAVSADGGSGPKSSQMQWRRIADVPASRVHACAGVVDGQIVVATSTLSMRYDCEADRWHALTPIYPAGVWCGPNGCFLWAALYEGIDRSAKRFQWHALYDARLWPRAPSPSTVHLTRHLTLTRRSTYRYTGWTGPIGRTC
jgi:hypothetical protein